MRRRWNMLAIKSPHQCAQHSVLMCELHFQSVVLALISHKTCSSWNTCTDFTLVGTFADNFDMRIYNLWCFFFLSFFLDFISIDFVSAGRHANVRVQCIRFHRFSSSHGWKKKIIAALNLPFSKNSYMGWAWGRTKKKKNTEKMPNNLTILIRFVRVCGFTCQLHTILHTICVIIANYSCSHLCARMIYTWRTNCALS